MVQVAAAFLFTLAAALGAMVILAMLKTNGQAILSALAGDGAFARPGDPCTDPAIHASVSRRPAARRDAPRPSRLALASRPQINRAA